jgi:hypothetical protein
LKKREKKLIETLMGKIAGCEFCGRTKGLRYIEEGGQHWTCETVDQEGEPHGIDTWVVAKPFYICQKCSKEILLQNSILETFVHSRFSRYFKKNI